MTKIKLTTNSQRDAIEWSGGPRLIIAGPGSGKTYVLTQCIAHLINEKGVDPQQILAVTFTKKAGKEMCDRVEKLVAVNKVPKNMKTFK